MAALGAALALLVTLIALTSAAVRRNDLPERRQRTLQFPADLAGFAGDQNFRHVEINYRRLFYAESPVQCRLTPSEMAQSARCDDKKNIADQDILGRLSAPRRKDPRQSSL